MDKKLSQILHRYILIFCVVQ